LYETGTLESPNHTYRSSFAPASIPLAPKATQAIPSANNPIIPYFKLAEGLYLLSHHLENNGAKEIINKEFKVENQVAGTSVMLLLYQFCLQRLIRQS
jgi:hypothetical protein